MTEEGSVLLEKYVDTAEEDRILRLWQHLLIELEREIHRQQGNLMPGGEERLRERVVAHAGPAVVGAGAWS